MNNINEANKKRIIEFIKNNSNATYKEIRNKTKLHPERYFKSLENAFKEAGINPPRNFKRKNVQKRKELIINYIKKNPEISSFQIKKQLGINVPSTFNSIKEAYKIAGINYPREQSYNKTPDEKRKEILELIKKNPNITLTEIMEKTKIKNLYRLFKNVKDIYKKAGVKKINGKDKIRIRKRNRVVEYIKNNNLATQREINKSCETKVQEIFDRGILEAYQKAGIVYPFERRKIHGTALKEIKNRAKNFENEIAIQLTGFGTVNKLVKTKSGIADIILERNNEKIVIEIKDYIIKEISISQINQLNRYLEDINSSIGILICHKKPLKDKFIIGKNRIFVLEKQEINQIPNIIKGAYFNG